MSEAFIKFEYTLDGYIQASGYLKSINHDVKELSEDGFTIVALANSILEKENNIE
jgi:hypothetical protein